MCYQGQFPFWSRMVAESLLEILSTPCPAVTVTATIVVRTSAAGDWVPSFLMYYHTGAFAVLATVVRRIDERNMF